MRGVTFCPIDFKRYLEKYLKEVVKFRIMTSSGNISCFLTTDKMYMSCHPNILFIGTEEDSVTIYNVVSIRIEEDPCDNPIDDIIIRCEDGNEYTVFAEKRL